EFQLINRWRELLNEYARLGLVSSTMSPRAAIGRLDAMASDVIFQAESVKARIHLMGALEASGLRFDGIWISGVTTANWPPAGAPSVLLSRRLQEEHGMPDCTPADTLQHAQQILRSLVASGDRVICSYALTEDDAEQTVSDLLTPLLSGTPDSPADSGLYATHLLDNVVATPVQDCVPAIAVGEKLSGGATTIQRQIRDPVTAFIHGRMGARLIYPQAIGIPATLRGNLIHDALFKLYIDLPASDVIRDWQGKELAARVEAAVNFAFSRHERNTDAVLQQLLLLERQRISGLLHQFVAVDGNRGSFRVSAVEGAFEFVAGNIRLPLRFDRIDTLDDGKIAILDYKTGTPKQLVGRDQEPQEIQLFVYAFAAGAVVSALALVNVDSREIAFDGVGRDYSNTDDWPDLLRRANEQITSACNELSAGDVRINIVQGVASARSLNVLTRYTELRHHNG
ncbi:MAG: PD-(D/E)XK nuclease family protein, partial [Woeseiaceae bacterium]|nr:PD-(D/E)XK nuclease family protein [Woeseiaceae bacterium]